MSKLQSAMKLADEFGVSFSKASKYIDDVGLDEAKRALDEAAEGGAGLVGDWWKPAVAVGGIGGGALAWNQQEVEQARELAEQSQSQSDALASLMNSDLSPEAKRALTEQLLSYSPNNDGDDSGGNSLLGNDVQTTAMILIVLVFVLKFALDGGDD